MGVNQHGCAHMTLVLAPVFCKLRLFTALAKMKFYAVGLGRKPGVYASWDECKLQVNGFGGAKYKGFGRKEDAENFVKSYSYEAKAKSNGSNTQSSRSNHSATTINSNTSTPASNYQVQPQATTGNHTMTSATAELSASNMGVSPPKTKTVLSSKRLQALQETLGQ